jgi:alpha-tubulin suppressor-like RCC1 family protein
MKKYFFTLWIGSVLAIGLAHCSQNSLEIGVETANPGDTGNGDGAMPGEEIEGVETANPGIAFSIHIRPEGREETYFLQVMPDQLMHVALIPKSSKRMTQSKQVPYSIIDSQLILEVPFLDVETLDQTFLVECVITLSRDGHPQEILLTIDGISVPTDFREKTQKFSQLSMKESHACALNTLGEVFCWGSGYSGELGDGGREMKVFPTPVVDEDGRVYSDFTYIAVGYQHSCAINTLGQILCWGRGDEGQTGQEVRQNSKYPQFVRNQDHVILDGFVSVALGATDTCALTEGGTIACWGSGTPHPSPVTDRQGNIYRNFTSLASGRQHQCAVTETHDVMCWGLGGEGQLGNGPHVNALAHPSLVSNIRGQLLADVLQISVSAYTSCALTYGGAIYCWGDMGQDAEGNLINISSAAILSDQEGSVLRGFQQITVGMDHLCALDHDAALFCWGNSSEGKLGTGNQDYQRFPTPVINENEVPLLGFDQIYAASENTCAISSEGLLYCWGRKRLLGKNADKAAYYPGLVVLPINFD